ncbi:MAG TPA: hypothetical protein VHI13_06570 [Candidatus Kapabacteria bacterium]|nr:hypothetical protein [Candidatus Kapabacteria bacterium]
MHNALILRFLPLPAVWVLLGLLALTSPASAQSWAWARTPGGPHPDRAGGIGLDSLGNSYLVGTYTGSITFDATTFSNGTHVGFFLARYSSFGILQWASQGNGTGNFTSAVIAVDRAGNSYAAGTFSGTVGFNGTQLVSQGGSDIFIARYDSYGIQQWAKRYGGTGDESVAAIAVDSAGGVVIAGSFSGSETIGGVLLASAGGDDLFVARYDTAGEPVWGLRAGGSGKDAARGVASAGDGAVLVTGWFNDTMVVGGTRLIAPHDGGPDAFVARLGSDGSPEWAERFGGPGRDSGTAIAADGAGNGYVTGTFTSSSVQFGGVTITNHGAEDGFVARLDPTGATLWARAVGGDRNDRALAIGLDRRGASYVTGQFGGTMSGPEGGITSAGGADLFVAKLDASGSVAWLRRAGGIHADEGDGIAVDSAGEAFVAATYDTSATFGDIVLQAAGESDVALARLGAPSTITTQEIPGNPFCTGAPIVVSFTTSGVFGSGNVFTAQLSDSAGSFASPVVLGSVSGTEGTSISVQVPNDLPTGMHYRIRVVSTVPPVDGTPEGPALAIYEPPAPVITPGPIAKLCSGQTLTLDAGAGYSSYQWSNGSGGRTIIVTEAGTYSVTVTNDAGCAGSSDPVTVTVIPSPEKPTIVKSGVYLECSTADTYQWLLNGEPIPNATNQRYQPDGPGIYSVRVTSANGCSALSDPWVVAAGVPAERMLSGVELFPQPTTGLFTVGFQLDRPANVRTMVIDAAGGVVFAFNDRSDGGAFTKRIDISALPGGAYFVCVRAGERAWVGGIVKR